MRVHSLLCGLAVACCSATAAFAGEPTKQLAAELLIVSADARRLAEERLGPQERQGLRKRIESALASLPLAMRRTNADPFPVKEMRLALERSDWARFAETVKPLLQRYPYEGRFLALPSTSQRIAAGAALHKETCAACHAVDWGDTLLPAKNLKEQRTQMPRVEFAARLWLGVRGTRETAYANPFSDEELAALIAYYESRE